MHDSFINSITISRADVNQLPLIKKFFKLNGFRPQAAKSDIIYIAMHNNIIVAALRLCHYNNSLLLRSMCIKAEYRRRGLGHYFLDEISSILKDNTCYCFAYTYLEKFYSSAGFNTIVPHKAEQEISELYNIYLSKGKKIILMLYSA